MHRIYSLIIIGIHYPLYILSLLIPKDPNLWMFGSWWGMKYSDNTKYLYEYVSRNEKSIKAVFITRNRSVVTDLRKKGLFAYYMYGVHGIWYSMRAGVCFTSQSKLSDLNNYVITKKTIHFALWHGIPMKKIAYDDNIFYSEKYRRYDAIRASIFPFMENNIDYMFACSTYDKNIFSSAFKLRKDKIFITGYPRNDALNNKNMKKRGVMNVLYAPTFRNVESMKGLLSSRNIEMLGEMAKKGNYRVTLKLHPVNEAEFIKSTYIIPPNINVLNCEDIYQELKNYGVLITDYSSLCFDYLLLNRPIILFPMNHSEYLSKDRELYTKYENLSLGYIASGWNDVDICLRGILCGRDKFIEKRKRALVKYHKYSNGNYSKRIVKEVMRITQN